MSIDSVYEQWEQRIKQAAREQVLKRILSMLYQARFGAVPSALAAAIDATHDTATLDRWIILTGTRSAEEVAAAVLADVAPASVS